MMEEAVQGAAVHAGRAAVGQVPDVVDLAGRGGLVTAAQQIVVHAASSRTARQPGNVGVTRSDA